MSNTEIQYNLSVSTELTYNEFRKLEIVLVRCLNFASRLTGDENLKKGIQVIEKTIMTLRTLQMAIRAVQAASGPIGWAYAATTVVATGFAMYDLTTGV